MTQSEQDFWKAVYVAAVQAGHKYPGMEADKAVLALRGDRV